MNEIVTLISNVGFPIACVIALGYYVNTTVKELSKTVADNTQVMQRLIDKLDE